MADVAEREDAKDVINNVNNIIAQIEHDAYIKMLGTYVESHIQNFLQRLWNLLVLLSTTNNVVKTLF